MPSKMDFVEMNRPTLLSTEALIVFAYKMYPKLHDHDVIRVIDQVMKYFRAKATNFPFKEPIFSLTITTELYDSLKNNLEDCKGNTAEDNYNILKFLKKSVEFWNREGGSQGYLKYITRFIDVEADEEENEIGLYN